MSLVIDVPADTVKLLLTPIDPEQPAGHFDVEDETFQAIDQEMVKLGGLREGDIDWPYIDEASRQYLATQCKHWRVVAHLQVVWLRTRQWARWADALGLLAGMVELYWDSAHPKPGPTGYLNKRKQVQRLLGDLGQVLPTLERSSFEPAYQAAAELALANLQRCAESAKLDPAPLDALQRQLDKYSEPVVASEPARAATSGSVLESAFFARPKPQAPSNEREQRRAVLNMAEQINQQDPYDPTGYQLRRFGLWSHLRTAPPITRDRRTELTAVPKDIVDGYQDALNHNAIEPNLLLRLEKASAPRRTGCVAVTWPPRSPRGWRWKKWRPPFARPASGLSAVFRPCWNCASATEHRSSMRKPRPGSPAPIRRKPPAARCRSTPACATNWLPSSTQKAWKWCCCACRNCTPPMRLRVSVATPR